MIGFFKKRKKNFPDFWNRYEAQFEEKLPSDISKVRFVVLDTETTGFDYETDRILSIGALSLCDNSIAVNQSFEVFLDQYFYHPKNIEIHGIMQEEPKERITEIEALMRFLKYIGNSVLVAHHAGFDIKMINQALRRHGMPRLRNKVLDTSILYKRSLIKSPLLVPQEQYTLDQLAEKFDISTKDRHTALGDAYITAIAFMKIVERLRQSKNLTLKKLWR
ncbi:3'-5' exonuclease [Pseudozobellia thermophila]|uniref:DNA polymerase-3 subunit epsilon n=1 Tax=Pseudozobellia thermophila TaxID=192903 RepID=A0A1M6INH6_9FLAO|nr:3'-5' exonuclease [Pseudozobellia thermophila]SHJ36006.1 DNA polymerase-3 subunit epsilon [Pseudozobellia thermophila]